MTGTNGFSAGVSFAITGLPAGVSATPATFTLTPSTSQNVILTAAANVTAAPISFAVTGTSGSISHTVMTSTTLPDFALAVPQAAVSLTAGSSAAFSISADAFNSFTGNVSLALTGLPQGVTVAPLSLALASGAPQTITLTAAPTAQPATTTISLQGTSGALAHNLDLTLAVSAAPPPPPADFSLTVAPATVSLQSGGGAQLFTVSAAGSNGFTAPIAVALTGLPAGVAAMPATFTLAPGTPQQVSLNASSTAAAGNSTLTLSGTAGSLSHNATVTVTVQLPTPDFSVSLNPASISLPIGGAPQQISVTANAVGAFNSPVTLSVMGLPAGVTASPASLTLTPGSAQTIGLQASSTATAGSTAVTLQGVAGALTRSATLSVTVAAPAPDFQLFAGPSMLNLGSIGSQQLTVALIPINGFNGAATVTVSGLPTGAGLKAPPLPLVANIPQTLWLYPGTATSGQTPITIAATSGTITHTAQVNLVITTTTSDLGPYIVAGSDPAKRVAIPGLLLTPGTYTFYVDAIGSTSATTVQLSGLVPGTGLDQTQYTYSGNPFDQAVFNITVTPSAVGERGVLTALFTGGEISHEVDLPIYVVAQPSLLVYLPSLSIQQGGATDIPYETASTSPSVVQLYLGPGWPQNFWLNPYPVHPADQQFGGLSGVEVADQLFGAPANVPGGQYSLSVDANMPSGPTSVSLQFVDGNLSQVVPMAVQVNPYSDFKMSVEPSTIALEAGATQTFKVSAFELGTFSGPIQVTLDNLPAGVQASPQSFTLNPQIPQVGNSQTITLTAGSGYSTGGTMSVDSTSGPIQHATQVTVDPNSATTTLIATGTTFSGLGVVQIFNSGTYNSVASIDPYPNSTYPNVMQVLLPYSPSPQLYPYISNCNGDTNNPACTAASLAIYPYASLESPVLDQPGTITLNATVPGVPSAVLHYDQILPDFTLTFSPSTLTIPAGGGATFAVTPSAISPTFTGYCGNPFVADKSGSKVFNATVTIPPGGLNVSPNLIDFCAAANPQTVSVSVPADTPPGNYEVSVNGLLNTGYQRYFSFQAQQNPIATITAAHTFGVGVTVTPAPPSYSGPTIQLAASPAAISIAAGQSFPITVSATVGGTLTIPITVSAANLPAGVTLAPSTFTLSAAGSSQMVTVSVASGTAAVSEQITFTGTSGSTTGSTQLSITVP